MSPPKHTIKEMGEMLKAGRATKRMPPSHRASKKKQEADPDEPLALELDAPALSPGTLAQSWRPDLGVVFGFELVSESGKPARRLIAVREDKYTLQSVSGPLGAGLSGDVSPTGGVVPWPGKYLKCAIDETLRGSFSEAFEKIKPCLVQAVDFPDECMADILSLYVLLSYVFRAVPSLPYIELTGDFGTGKTRTLKMMSLLSFRGEMQLNPSASSVFRTVASVGGTLCLDEVENSLRPEKQEIAEVLRGGYTSGGIVTRVDRDTGRVLKFSSYSPKVLAHVRKIETGIASRCIPIHLRRNLNRKKGDILLDEGPMADATAQARDACFRAALWEGLAFRRKFEDPETLEALGTMTGRPRELLRTLAAMSLIVDPKADLLKMALEYGHDVFAERAEDILGQGKVILMQVLRERFAEDDSDRLEMQPKALAELVADVMTQEGAGKKTVERINGQQVGYWMKSLDLGTRAKNRGIRVWNVRLQRLQEVMRSYDVSV